MTTSGEVMHIVLFEWKKEAAPEAIEQAVAALKGLKATVPGIKELSIGVDFSTRGRNWHHALVVHFEDKSALDVYGPHPAHQHVVETFIQHISQDVMAFDYVI